MEVTDSGLVINPQWPFIAAPPDGVINCDCHGKGVLEINCPFTHETITEVVMSNSSFCLEDRDGCLQLNCKHTYYYQVHADFCMCTFPSNSENSAVFVERIYQDNDFWKTVMQNLRSSLLP